MASFYCSPTDLSKLVLSSYVEKPELGDNKELEMEGVKVTDTLGSLKMLHYVKCSSDSPNDLKMYRGVVKNEKGEIVMKSFPFVEEVSSLNKDRLKEELKTLFGNENGNKIGDGAGDKNRRETLVYESLEGTLLRVWNYNETWHVSTHRKFYADKSFWGCNESHLTLFKKHLHNTLEVKGENDDSTMENFLSSLDANLVYTFLVKSEENRIVCKGGSNVYFVGAFNKLDNFKFLQSSSEQFSTISLPRPQKLELNSLDDILSYVDLVDPFIRQGVMIYTVYENGELNCLKILSPKYEDLFSLRGNVSNLDHRYLQFYGSEETESLKELYPEKAERFDEFDKKLNEICLNMYTGYMNRYVKKLYVVLPKPQWFVVKQVRSTRCRATPEVFKYFLANYPTEEKSKLLWNLMKHS